MADDNLDHEQEAEAAAGHEEHPAEGKSLSLMKSLMEQILWNTTPLFLKKRFTPKNQSTRKLWRIKHPFQSTQRLRLLRPLPTQAPSSTGTSFMPTPVSSRK